MADYWEAPKTNWLTSDVIGYDDLNRIESDVSAIRDATYRKVQGFGYSIDNSVVGKDGVVTVFPGSCYSNSGFPIKMAANYVKNLNSWAAGNGSAYGGMASAVAAAAHTWYYAFVIMNPTDGSTEIMFDDNPSGTNISSGTYTEKRFVNSFKTAAAGGDGSFDLVEMYSDGDRVYINPSSMYATRVIPFDNSVDNNTYVLKTLTLGAEGFALPARVVQANLNIEGGNIHFGFISDYLNTFTVPTDLYVLPGTLANAEFLCAKFGQMVDIDIVITAARQINLAIYDAATTGTVEIAVRGFNDERLI